MPDKVVGNLQGIRTPKIPDQFYFSIHTMC
jgi:hypothetical protein